MTLMLTRAHLHARLPVVYLYANMSVVTLISMHRDFTRARARAREKWKERRGKNKQSVRECVDRYVRVCGRACVNVGCACMQCSRRTDSKHSKLSAFKALHEAKFELQVDTLNPKH